jgi:hypothetical protein
MICYAFACVVGIVGILSGGWLAGCGQDSASTPPASATPTVTEPALADRPVKLDTAPPRDAYEQHARLFSEDRFPSAMECGRCHPTHFRQWSVSQHSYAQLSPIFNAMHGKISKGNNSTNGDFCIRCHTQPGMTLGEKEFMSNIDRDPIAREGVTCVVCHRMDTPVGKNSGRLPLDEGELTDPIYGPTGRNSEIQKAIAYEDLSTDPKQPGKKVHGKARKFFRLTTPAFCGSCHDVTLFNGFRLEEAFSEYKHSPAARNGVTCQDCHMGKEPGRILADKKDPDFERLNYGFGSAAVVGDFETAPRKLTSHLFVGPDYSVLPPWLFPHHHGAIKDPRATTGPAAYGLATIREWQTFNWQAGWGTDSFEAKVAPGTIFPPRWRSADDRRNARKIINENLALLAEMSDKRLTLLRNGYKLGQVVNRKFDRDGLVFSVQVKSGTDGHNVPTGFDVERPVWLHVTVKDATGKIIKESGDLDPNGDVRDLQSQYVRNRQLPEDDELFSLQGHFIVHMERGSEREQVLATNYSLSPLPFLRPERMSAILQGKPQGARKQKNNIEPLGQRWATYTIDKSHLTGKTPYIAVIQLKSAMVPANLVREVKDVGFDYNLDPETVRKNLLAGHKVVWEQWVKLTD